MSPAPLARSLRAVILILGLSLAAAPPVSAQLTHRPPEISAGGDMNRRVHRGEIPTPAFLPSLGGTTPLAAFTGGPGFTAWDFDQNAIENSGALFVPPDPMGAAGQDRLINVINAGIECWTKSGLLLFRDDLKAFFSASVGNLGTAAFDPKVVYDQYADRFVIVALEQTDTTDPSPTDESRILVAVSKTSAPGTATAGDWYYHVINSKIAIGGIPSWADYPGLETDEEVIYITANMFNFASFASSYAVRLWIVHKGLVGGFYDGGAATVTVHNPTAAGLDVTTMPAKVFGGSGAGPGIGTYLVGYDNLTFGGAGGNEALQVIRVNNPTAAVSFTPEFVTVGDLENVGGVYGFPSLPGAPQSGTGVLIEVNDSRALDAVLRDGSLWCTTTIRPNLANDVVNADQTTAHWYRISTSAVANSGSPAGLLALADQGNIGGEDIAPGAYTFFPSVAVNDLGEAKFGFAASAPGIFAGAYLAGREAGDPAGALQPAMTVHAGEDYYIRTFGGPQNRWGDYSGMSVDPADERVFWAFNQFAMPRGTLIGGEQGRWRTAWLSCATSCLSLVCPADTTVPMSADPALQFGIMNCGGVRETYDYALGDTATWCAPAAGSVAVDPGQTVYIPWNCINPALGLCADSTLIVFQVTSSAGEADACSTSVAVVNNPPTVLCKNIIIVGDSVTCVGTATAADVDNGSFDPEGHPFNLVLIPPGPYSEGLHNVQLIATDSCGDADTCEAVITVQCPSSAPQVNCSPLDITFASVSAPDTVCRTVTIRNVGTGDPLLIQSVLGCGGNGFHLDLSGISTAVPAGDSTSFAICYSPDDALPDSCQVSIATNDTTCVVDVQVAAVTAVGDPVPGARAVLSAVSPNPFAGNARIRFTLPETGAVRLDVFDARGRLVRRLIPGDTLPAGTHEAVWNGETGSGGRAPGGIYFVRLVTAEGARVTRAVLAR